MSSSLFCKCRPFAPRRAFPVFNPADFPLIVNSQTISTDYLAVRRRSSDASTGKRIFAADG
ncbi:MAG TPA: hypothetical protein VEQ34_06495 [Pyrinomonadaceae bacterium]|nr:hypothetical protein [Pyrinomonadaceae bacterium]